MKRYTFDKLIRSKLPARMRKEGVILNTEILSDENYIKQLKNKIVEEANEVVEASNIEDIKTELADVLEVIHALASANDIEMSEVENTRLKKRQVNGYFHPSCYVHYIEVEQDNSKVIEYLENKNRPYLFVSS